MLDCCCGQYKEVELCPCKDCSLYPYRFGKNPNIKLTDEQKAAKAENLRKVRKSMGAFNDVDSNKGKDTPEAVPAENAM